MMWPVVNLPLEQLVERVALRRGYLPLRADCTVTRTDGVDISSLLAIEVKSCYARALATMPFDELPVTDIAYKCSLVVMPDGCGSVLLPENVVRVGWVKLSSWMRSVMAVGADHEAVAAQGNRWSRGGAYNPVAVEHGSTLNLYSPDPQGDAIERLEVVAMPHDIELFALTDPMIEWIMKNVSL